jgi:transposase InsO family protein
MRGLLHGFYCRVAQYLPAPQSIWVIVDRLTKTTHFLPVHTTHKTEKYAEIYVDQIVRLHGILRTIVSDREALFVARFWEKLQKSLGTTVIRSSAYHPQTDGQIERVNQILEDMLRACVLHYGKNWDKCFHWQSCLIITATSSA